MKRTGVILLNFGEPAEPTMEKVVPFLERIFGTNASLEASESPEAARERSRELARRRAPGLIEEYEEIGGSPLNEQAHAQAAALREELAGRGCDVEAYVGMQFAEPLIREAVEAARADGAELLIGLPVYPLAGPSTTVAALEELAGTVDDVGWPVELVEIGGWHRHPDQAAMWADRIRGVADEDGLDLGAPGTKLVFSAHGTPMKYLDEGSRYLRYVEDSCRSIAGAVGVEEYVIGYQNHANRDIPWTQPDIEDVIGEVEAERVVVVPVSFMHEQSETLAELDIELKEEAEEAGLGFHRVPVPHDDPRLPVLLADLVEPFITGEGPEDFRVGQCECRKTPRTRCLNFGEV